MGTCMGVVLVILIPNQHISILQIVRHTKPIYVLKSYCSTPSRNPLTFMWLCHTFVSLKVNVFLLFAHISSYFILITFLFLALLPDIQMRDSYLSLMSTSSLQPSTSAFCLG